ATGGGLALASKKPAKTIPPAADGTITACARHQDGRLRLVANASKCTKKEQVVTWNQKGPGGTADDPGSVVVGELTLNGVTVPTVVPDGTQQFSAGALERLTFAYEKVTVTIGADHFSYDLRQGKKF